MLWQQSKTSALGLSSRTVKGWGGGCKSGEGNGRALSLLVCRLAGTLAFIKSMQLTTIKILLGQLIEMFAPGERGVCAI